MCFLCFCFGLFCFILILVCFKMLLIDIVFFCGEYVLISRVLIIGMFVLNCFACVSNGVILFVNDFRMGFYSCYYEQRVTLQKKTKMEALAVSRVHFCTHWSSKTLAIFCLGFYIFATVF